MIKHFCDKCGNEVATPHSVYDFELCDKCHSKLEETLGEVAEKFISGELESNKKANKECQSEWHDIRLGYPSITGVYLVAIRRNGYSSSRLAKYNNGTYGWYKLGKYSDAFIEEDGGEVVAWAEIPAPFEG